MHYSSPCIPQVYKSTNQCVLISWWFTVFSNEQFIHFLNIPNILQQVKKTTWTVWTRLNIPKMLGRCKTLPIPFTKTSQLQYPASPRLKIYFVRIFDVYLCVYCESDKIHMEKTLKWLSLKDPIDQPSEDLISSSMIPRVLLTTLVWWNHS